MIQLLLRFLPFLAIVVIVPLRDRAYGSPYISVDAKFLRILMRSKIDPDGRITVVKYTCRSKIGELCYVKSQTSMYWMSFRYTFVQFCAVMCFGSCQYGAV